MSWVIAELRGMSLASRIDPEAPPAITVARVAGFAVPGAVAVVAVPAE